MTVPGGGGGIRAMPPKANHGGNIFPPNRSRRPGPAWAPKSIFYQVSGPCGTDRSPAESIRALQNEPGPRGTNQGLWNGSGPHNTNQGPMGRIRTLNVGSGPRTSNQGLQDESGPRGTDRGPAEQIRARGIDQGPDGRTRAQ